MIAAHPFARLISRLLIAVMLLHIALPSWAALSGKDKAGWIEICAAGGLQWVKFSAPDAPLTAHAPASSDHCLLCASTGAPAAFDIHQYLLRQQGDVPVLFSITQTGSGFPGHAILSRAPPSYL